jgi:hypothetical protein
VATYLDVLVELLTDLDARAGYEKDPAVWLRTAGVGFLCGEDVVAGAAYLREWQPELGAALDELEGVDPAPRDGESELDAAIRVIEVVCVAAPLEDQIDLADEDNPASVS